MIVDVKRDFSANVVLNTLFKQTNLQVSTGINFLALVRGKPVVLNLKQMLEEYVAHQIDVTERRTRYNLTKAQEREHIVKGLIIAIANIDEVVEIIKKSRERSTACTSLMETFLLSEKQANAILDMRLASLTGLQVEKLEEEEKELQEKIADYTDILAKPERVRAIIKEELTSVKDAYGADRKSELSYDESEIDIEDLIEKEDVVISMTNQGYIKRIALKEYKAQNRGGVGVTAHKTKDEDFVKKMFVCNTHNDLLFFSNMGKAYKLRAYRVPEATKTSKGRAMVNVLPLSEGERITAFLPVEEYTDDHFIVMATKDGLIRKSEVSEFESVRANGKIAITLLGDDELIEVEMTNGKDDIIVASHNGKCIRFAEEDVRRTGRGSQGVRSIKLDEGDYLVDMAVVDETKTLMTISEKGFGKRTDTSEFRTQSRAGKGIKAGNFNEKTGLLVNMKLVGEDDDVIFIGDNGTMIRIRANQVNKIGRSTKGVTIMKMKGDAKVVSMAVTMHDEEADFDAVEVDEEALKEAQAEAASAPKDEE
jgi:DNA gyrase subunit A